MDSSKLQRYNRIYSQLEDLFKNKKSNRAARMASMVALLHYKMNCFFWTGFYLIDEFGELMVNNYQGPLACMLLEKNKGVCWAAINMKETVIVGDVNLFPGHIACSSLTKSEIVVPLVSKDGEVLGCLDIDSKDLNSFDEDDKNGLERLIQLIC